MQAGKSFVLDEIDFPIVAHETSKTFKPIYYRGESSPFHVGTYHPTLYINSLAVFIKIFGFNEVTVRFFGLICTLISAYLLLLILRKLIKKNETAEILLLGLYLLNPYTIANTTLPDIDSTILPIMILLFTYFSLKYLLQKKNMSNKVVYVLGALFGLALWSKLTTPLILPPLLACVAVITSRNYKKSILFTGKVTLLGCAAFVSTYFIYCKLLNLSASYTYEFLLDSFTKGTSGDGLLVGALNNLKNIRYFVYWPTLPIVTLLVISFYGIIFDGDKGEKTKVKKLLVSISLLVTIFYIALIAPFGGFFKYPFPVFGLLILTIVLFYDRYLRNIKLHLAYPLTAVFLGLMIERTYWKDSMFINAKPFSGLIALSLIATACFIFLKIYSRRFIAILFTLALFFAIGFQLSVSRIQAISPYSTKYLYGQSGLNQTAAYLRSNTNLNEAIWSMKDVGYYTNNRYYESYGYYFDKSLESDLSNMLKSKSVRYYVVTTGIGQDNIDYYANIKQILDVNAVREKQFGNFIIYKAKE